MGSLDALSRRVVTAALGVLVVWGMASLTMPRADAVPPPTDPVALARFEPLGMFIAIASDRPAESLHAGRDGESDVLPAILATEAGTRSALHSDAGDGHFPASLMSTSPLTVGLARRGPPSIVAS